jgi:hypothetical protein
MTEMRIYFFLCMHIIKFTQLFQMTKNSKTLPFLLLPDANLNPDFQKHIAVGERSKQRPRVA